MSRSAWGFLVTSVKIHVLMSPMGRNNGFKDLADFSVPGSNYLSKEIASAKNKFTSNMSRRLGSSSASSREEEDS